jgi:aspartate/methionine/tyrosine aminotransferase
MHVFSMSKSFGMAGWRVGYLVYPRNVPGLHDAMRSLQDTIPTHAANAAQAVARAAMDDTDGLGGVQVWDAMQSAM